MDQREKFEVFVKEKYIDGDSKKSKTVTKDKLLKITNCLKNDPCAREYCPKFKHWVKQRGFSLMNYGALGLKDVLCLPARSKNNNDPTILSGWRRVVPVEEFFNVISEVHCREKGHIGSKKTVTEIGKIYECVPRCAIDKFVELCLACHTRKPQNTRGPLKPIISSGFMTRGQVDLIDMRHRPDGTYKWIGHYMDHWAKMHFLFPLCRKSGAEVALNLQNHVFSFVGVPRILHSDNGREFVNEIVECVVKEWPGEVTIVNGRPRNPKCQGLIEQGNHMVEKLLGVRLHEYNGCDDYPPWSEWLSFIQYQLNTTVHGTVKVTPYELVFGQPPRQNIFPGVKSERIMEEDVEDLFEDVKDNERDDIPGGGAGIPGGERDDTPGGERDDIPGEDVKDNERDDITGGERDDIPGEDVKDNERDDITGGERDDTPGGERDDIPGEDVKDNERDDAPGGGDIPGEDVKDNERDDIPGGERDDIPGEDVKDNERDDIPGGERDDARSGERDDIPGGETDDARSGERDDIPGGERDDARSGERDDIPGGERDDARSGERDDIPGGERDDAQSGEASANENTTVQLASTEKHRKLREEADKRYRDNAEKMQLKYCKGKRKKIMTFHPGNFVSVRIPRIDCASTDHHRLPCVVVERLGKEHHLYRLRSSFGVLKTCFGENDLELYCGSLPLTVDGWEKDPLLSLREAAKKLNPINDFDVGCCNCKGGCRNQRCACRKKGSPCTSKCHQGTSCSNCPPSPSSTKTPEQKPAKRQKIDAIRNTAATNLILKRRQKNTAQAPTVIDLTTGSDKKTTSRAKIKTIKEWVKVEDISLTEKDRDILLHPTAWMTDNILAAGQRLLQKQTGAHGLQPPCLGQTCAFDIQKKDFVQIISNGYDHWLTVSTIGAADGTVNVYDSLYVRVGSRAKDQIAAIVNTDEREISLNFIDVQKQRGTCDCGLFSFAFATCLANGCLPERQVFDQTKMRSHLYACLRKSELTMFPITKQRAPRKVVISNDTIPVYCDCRMPEDNRMIQCSECELWYHTYCVDVPKAALEDSKEPWYCNKC